MTQSFALAIKRSMTKEDKMIGNIKSRYLKQSLRGQRNTNITPNYVAGDIALAYHRGLAQRDREIVLLKKQIKRLKDKLKTK